MKGGSTEYGQRQSGAFLIRIGQRNGLSLLLHVTAMDRIKAERRGGEGRGGGAAVSSLETLSCDFSQLKGSHCPTGGTLYPGMMHQKEDFNRGLVMNSALGVSNTYCQC